MSDERMDDDRAQAMKALCLTYLDVTVFDESDEIVAKSLVTYKLSRIPG